MRIPIHREHPEPRKIDRAVRAVESGEVIAYPTDTVYGLGCDALQKKAVDRLYQIKQMPRSHPVTFLCPDLSDIARYAVVDNQTYRVLKRLTPGPYCFILLATREVPKTLMVKRKTVGIRVPAEPAVRDMLRRLGRPLVSTSASWQGEILNDPDDVDDRFRGLSLVLDAGYGGLEPSTIVDLTEGELVVRREGAGPVDELLASSGSAIAARGR